MFFFWVEDDRSHFFFSHFEKKFKGKLASFPSPTHTLYWSKPIPQNKEKKNLKEVNVQWSVTVRKCAFSLEKLIL